MRSVVGRGIKDRSIREIVGRYLCKSVDFDAIDGIEYGTREARRMNRMEWNAWWRGLCISMWQAQVRNCSKQFLAVLCEPCDVSRRRPNYCDHTVPADM